MDWVELLNKVSTGTEPVNFLVAVQHYHTVGVTSGDLRCLLIVLLVNQERSRRQLGIHVFVAELSFVARAPGVDFSKR